MELTNRKLNRSSPYLLVQLKGIIRMPVFACRMVTWICVVGVPDFDCSVHVRFEHLVESVSDEETLMHVLECVTSSFFPLHSLGTMVSEEYRTVSDMSVCMSGSLMQVLVCFISPVCVYVEVSPF